MSDGIGLWKSEGREHEREKERKEELITVMGARNWNTSLGPKTPKTLLLNVPRKSLLGTYIANCKIFTFYNL